MKKECFEIFGGKELYGKIKNQTSKNAILPILSASLLCDGEVKLKNFPHISDVYNMIDMLKNINVDVKIRNHKLTINAKQAKNYGMDSKLSKTMRSSLFLLGPMLCKFKSVCLTMPGGCNIGKRPIDIHIHALKKLGVKIKSLGNKIFFDAGNVHSSTVKFRFPSVGATENIIQFAVLLKGKTEIINSAKEPEVCDLCNFLNKAGANIVGAGTNKITIYGVGCLKCVDYVVMYDRIVSGTIMCAVAVCGGNVKIEHACVKENQKIINILRSLGCQITTKSDIIHIVSSKNLVSNIKIITGCYPDFATDLQSLILSVLCVCKGISSIEEKIFENRFLIVKELIKMGAKISLLNTRKVLIYGVDNLKPAKLIAKDLRGGAALLIAGLSAKGKTIVENAHFIDRGYENIENMFNCLGACIKRR